MQNIKKAILPEIVGNNCSNLCPDEQNKVLEVLTEFQDLLDGTCDWETEPVSFELKEGSKPYHGKAFPIPQVHKVTVMKEIKIL